MLQKTTIFRAAYKRAFYWKLYSIILSNDRYPENPVNLNTYHNPREEALEYRPCNDPFFYYPCAPLQDRFNEFRSSLHEGLN